MKCKLSAWPCSNNRVKICLNGPFLAYNNCKVFSSSWITNCEFYLIILHCCFAFASLLLLTFAWFTTFQLFSLLGAIVPKWLIPTLPCKCNFLISHSEHPAFFAKITFSVQILRSAIYWLLEFQFKNLKLRFTSWLSNLTIAYFFTKYFPISLLQFLLMTQFFKWKRSTNDYYIFLFSCFISYLNTAQWGIFMSTSAPEVSASKTV